MSRRGEGDENATVWGDEVEARAGVTNAWAFASDALVFFSSWRRYGLTHFVMLQYPVVSEFPCTVFLHSYYSTRRVIIHLPSS